MKVDPRSSARAAGLRYVDTAAPGLRRERRGKGFRYVDAKGRVVRHAATLKRIRSLVIPPAWEDVWICPSANGHVQCTGRDAKGRKQYRYHPHWTAARDETKYERTIAFGERLPHIRRRIHRDMAKQGLPREKVLATVVRLLETTLIRVGNEEYARKNHSYGLTTMKDQHVDIHGAAMKFHFRGKSGVQHDVDVRDRRLARVVRRCQAIPGQELFQYLDENGERRCIDSSDVNAYLHEVAGEDFTAKDFRTWAGTLLAARALQEIEHFDSEAQAKRNVVEAIERVAKRLGNTRSVCRKCYVHPEVIHAYMDGTLRDMLGRRVEKELKTSLTRLSTSEAAVLAFLQERLKHESGRRRAA